MYLSNIIYAQPIYIPVIRVLQQMHSQLVNRWETFCTMLTLVLPFAMMCPDVFANDRILDERSLAVRATEYTILISMCFNMILQHRTLAK